MEGEQTEWGIQCVDAEERHGIRWEEEEMDEEPGKEEKKKITNIKSAKKNKDKKEN